MAWTDPTLAHIRKLHPDISSRAVLFINDLRAAGIPAWVSDSLRTPDVQRRLVAAGASRTRSSKHLTGHAFDIDILGYGRDDLPRWWWQAVGEYGESLGLRWGGRFTNLFDAGHFET